MSRCDELKRWQLLGALALQVVAVGAWENESADLPPQNTERHGCQTK